MDPWKNENEREMEQNSSRSNVRTLFENDKK